MEEKKQVPQIRFKGYVDAWEQRKFGDDNDLITGYPFESEKFSEKGIKLVRGMNVKRGYLNFSEEICMKWNSSNGLEKYLLEDGDILVQMDGALIGKSYARIAENQLPALLVQRVTRARTKSKSASPDFMYQIIQRDFLRYIELNKTETAVPHLSLNDIRNFEIMVPNIDEQKAIGNFLTNLDNLITLHRSKYDKLVNIKKSMLEKMFPKNGSDVPEIRFKGFTDAWEQRKFDEVFDCTIPNNTLSRAELNYESGSVRNIHYGDILIKYGSVVDVQNDEIPFATGKSSDDFKGALLQDGDIIIADTAEDETTGKVCEIGNLQGLDVVSGLHTMVCRPRNKMAFGYLGYYLNSDAYHHQLLPLMQGIKVLSLSRTNVQKTMVCYPKSKDEQHLIADYFRNLDNLITLHQRKLEKLKNIKKSMLDKMFV